MFYRYRSNRLRAVMAAVFAAVLLLCMGDAVAVVTPPEEQPIDFRAAELVHDDANQTVTALGDVEFVQAGKILRAEKVVYNLTTDEVTASGNVTLVNELGDIHFADELALSQDMKKGYIGGLLSLLSDGSRFTAREGLREDGNKTVMKDAAYTPCNVCETNPDPLWQIKASKVVHDQAKKTIRYEKARMEFLGVPLVYTPLFSHADPSVTRKSGLLRPQYGFSSETGAFAEVGYYFGNIAPHMDASLFVRPTSQKGVLVHGDWRQRFEKGTLRLRGGGVESDRDEEDGRIEEDRLRGHLFADGLYNFNDKWRGGLSIQTASDKSYLRLYDISNDNVLENQAYLERFSGRNYTNLRAIGYRDIRLGIRPDQAEIIPQLSHRMLGAPGGLLGGRWEAGISTLFLHRGDDDEQDMERSSFDLGWERRFVADSGLVTRLHTGGRADYYKIRDNTLIAAGQPDDTEDFRGAFVANLTTSYPLQKRLGSHMSWLVEPVAGASYSPPQDENEVDIPNEDSLDIQIDTLNLFDDNRFPGSDRQEDDLRLSYGLKSGLYADSGRYGRIFLGQTRRFDNAAYYPDGSGLEDKASAYVGQINLGLLKRMQADYRFQLDNDNFASQRHEFRSTGVFGPLTSGVRYFYINGITGTGYTETREQAEVTAEYRFTPLWRGYGSALHDLGEEPGLRRASLGLGYQDECFTFALEGARNLTIDAAGESETVLLARIGFKNIGEFSGPEILLKSAEEE